MNIVLITAQVSAQSQAGEMLKIDVILPDGNQSLTIPTDADGKAEAMFQLSPGHYTVVASMEETAVYEATISSAEFDVVEPVKETRTIAVSIVQQ